MLKLSTLCLLPGTVDHYSKLVQYNLPGFEEYGLKLLFRL